jgi:hypothetical protein
MPGVGIAKIHFHPGVNSALANAQITAISQTILRQLPPGATPLLILNYTASTAPILQLTVSAMGQPEQKQFDLAQNQIARVGFAKIGAHQYNIALDNAPDSVEGVERSSGEDRERRHDIFARRRACARWLRTATECRAC